MKYNGQHLLLTISSWLYLTRPHTLFLSVASTLTGCVLAWQYNTFSYSVSLCVVITAVLLQILCNIANDYGDMLNGVDVSRNDKVLFSAQELKYTIIFWLFMTVLSGLLLIHLVSQYSNNYYFYVLGIILGVIAIIAALTYTLGTKPYGYNGLGDVAVFIFFGLIAVLASFYFNSQQLVLDIIWCAIAMGLWCVMVLNLNNMRDRVSDATHGKITLAVKLGQRNSLLYHWLLMLLALFCWNMYAWQHYPFEVSMILMISSALMSLFHTIHLLQKKDDYFSKELKTLSIGIFFQVLILMIVPVLMMNLRNG